METKICNKCGKEKHISNFYKHSETKDGYFNSCKKCNKLLKKSWIKSKDGVIYTIFATQKMSSKIRHHNPPSYTFSEFKSWLVNKELFHKLYNEWVKSGYNRWCKPSVDRIDDYKGYSFDNIQLMTWKENNTKAHNDVKNGINNKKSKAVLQYDLDGNFVKRYHSLHNASENTGFDRRDIRRSCNGERKYVHGYRWVYE